MTLFAAGLALVALAAPAKAGNALRCEVTVTAFAGTAHPVEQHESITFELTPGADGRVQRYNNSDDGEIAWASGRYKMQQTLATYSFEAAMGGLFGDNHYVVNRQTGALSGSLDPQTTYVGACQPYTLTPKM